MVKLLYAPFKETGRSDFAHTYVPVFLKYYVCMYVLHKPSMDTVRHIKGFDMNKESYYYTVRTLHKYIAGTHIKLYNIILYQCTYRRHDDGMEGINNILHTAHHLNSFTAL